MLTAAEVAIFDQEIGTMNAVTLGCELENGAEKSIVVFGERTQSGVLCEIGFIDTDQVEQVLSSEE